MYGLYDYCVDKSTAPLFRVRLYKSPKVAVAPLGAYLEIASQLLCNAKQSNVNNAKAMLTMQKQC